MNTNVGGADRLLRIVIGLALLSMLYWVGGASRWVGLVGVVLIGTALAGWCPLYTVLGVRT